MQDRKKYTTVDVAKLALLCHYQINQTSRQVLEEIKRHQKDTTTLIYMRLNKKKYELKTEK